MITGITMPSQMIETKFSPSDDNCSTGSLEDDFFESCRVASTFSTGFKLSCWDIQKKGSSIVTTTSRNEAFNPPLHHFNNLSSEFCQSPPFEDDGESSDSSWQDHQPSRKSLVIVKEDSVGYTDNDLDFRDDNKRRTSQLVDSPIQKSSSTRHVHFSVCVVTDEFLYEKPSTDDFFVLYYSAHELQRIQDQHRSEKLQRIQDQHRSEESEHS
jgi:hypothetical protein